MTTKPIIIPNIDIVELAGLNGVTNKKTKKEIKTLESKIHRETEDSELDEHVKDARDRLKEIPDIGDQYALELLEISANGLLKMKLRRSEL